MVLFLFSDGMFGEVSQQKPAMALFTFHVGKTMSFARTHHPPVISIFWLVV